MRKQDWAQGIVDWFDELSGEGMVKTEDGRWFYFHYSAITSGKKRKSIKPNAEVKFQLHEDQNFSQVETLVPLRTR
jgi:cold shock CspA family protein